MGAVWGTQSPRGAVSRPDVPKVEIRAGEGGMKIKKAALRAEDSGAPWGRLEENGGFLLSNTALPSSVPPHSSPRPPLAGLRSPHWPKREKEGRERECGAQLVRRFSLPPAPGVRLPGLVQVGAGDAGEAPWFFLEYPAGSETG